MSPPDERSHTASDRRSLLLAAGLVALALGAGFLVSLRRPAPPGPPDVPTAPPPVNAPGASTAVPVVPPGQEALLSDLLGKGVELPGGCRWVGASIERSTVLSRYTCGEAEHFLTLCHPKASCAEGAGATTTRFALSGNVPAPLLDFLAARLRQGEAPFVWEEEAGPPPALSPLSLASFPEQQFPWFVFLIASAALFLATLSALSARWWLTRGGAPLHAHPEWQRFAVSCLAALAFFALLHSALRALGTLVWATLKPTSVSAGEAALSLVAFALLAGFGLALATSVRARGPSVLRLLVVGVLFTAVSWPLSLVTTSPKTFGALTTLPPGMLPYPINSHGFRGAEWELQKAAGTLRVGLIGDSFVEGSGLSREEDTLAAQLAALLRARAPGRAVEVLNLGLGGDNLGSHVTLVGEATERLGLDVVVLCLTLPNDLSPWDAQVERRDARRLSAFSLVRWLVGDAAALVSARVFVPLTGPALQAFASAQFTRLGQLHGERPLVIFSFHRPTQEVAALARAVPGATFVEAPPMERSDFIPGDGHPTARGNQRFAAAIADGLAADPVAGPLLRAAP